MTVGCGVGIAVAVLAARAGMLGIALLGAGRLHYGIFIVMTELCDGLGLAVSAACAGAASGL